jgi:hypothetical protein
LKTSREIKNGVEVGKSVESKSKMEHGKLVKETKTTILNPDGT